MVQSREAFLDGTPSPDFPGGKGESEHIGRPGEDYVHRFLNPIATQAMGLAKLEARRGVSAGEMEALEKANGIFGF
jgi:hypothetical protein